MKALVKKERKPGLWIDDVLLPEVKDHEVLIKTKKNAICGTDVSIYQWTDWAQRTIPVPMVVGHEFVGHIVEVGKKVTNFKVGERVCGEGHTTCGLCINCLKGKRHLCLHTINLGVNRHGSFAEYFTLPAENVFKLPESISDDMASIFDPFGNAVHTALTFNLAGEDVLITGAGPIGIMAAAIARKAGARQVVVTDLMDYRLNLAKKLGATKTVNVSVTPLESLDMENHFTVGLEMSGSPKGFNSMLKAMRHGGQIALLGLLPQSCQIDWDLVIFKMLTLKGIYGREIFDTWFKMVNLIEGGLELDPVITHHFHIDDYEQGFAAMISGKSGKVILNWD